MIAAGIIDPLKVVRTGLGKRCIELRNSSDNRGCNLYRRRIGLNKIVIDIFLKES